MIVDEKSVEPQLIQSLPNTADPVAPVRVIEASIPKPVVPPSEPVVIQMPPQSLPKVDREHKRLQYLIKQLGENCGYKAVIEQPTDDGQGRVDVGLERDSERVACEICVTTPPEHELQNIRKCLASGYDNVIFTSPDRKSLEKVKNLCTKELSESEIKQVMFFEPDSLAMFFEQQAADAAGQTKKVKGYTVKTNYQPLGDADKDMKRKALAQIVFKSFRRDKPKE